MNSLEGWRPAALAGILVGGLPDSSRSDSVTAPFGETSRIIKETRRSTNAARASSRSNRREIFLAVMFVIFGPCAGLLRFPA